MMPDEIYVWIVPSGFKSWSATPRHRKPSRLYIKPPSLTEIGEIKQSARSWALGYEKTGNGILIDFIDYLTAQGYLRTKAEPKEEISGFDFSPQKQELKNAATEREQMAAAVLDFADGGLGDAETGRAIYRKHAALIDKLRKEKL